MSEQVPPPPFPWTLRPLGRVVASASVSGACFLATRALPRETRVMLCLDLLLLTFVALVYVLMSVATAEQCADLAVKGRGLEKKAVLVATILASVVSIVAIGTLYEHADTSVLQTVSRRKLQQVLADPA